MTCTLLYVVRDGRRVSLSVGVVGDDLYIVEAGTIGPWRGELTAEEDAAVRDELAMVKAYEERRAA